MRPISVGLSALMLVLAPAIPAVAGEQATTESSSLGVERLLSMSVDGTILVDTDGSVRDYTLATPLAPNLSALLGKAIKGWRFEPVLVDGEVVRAEAKMRISLAATKDGENYQVRIENAVFRPAETGLDSQGRGSTVEASGRRMNPPKYPHALQLAGLSGRVLVALHFSPEGKVIDAVPVQAMVFDARGRDRTLAQAIKLLEDSTVQAARKWSVTVSTKPGAVTTEKDFTAYTTVEYVMDNAPGYKHGTPYVEPAGQWRMVARTPKRALPWLSGESAPNVGVADVGAGDSYSPAVALRLKSPVANTAL